MSDREHLNIPFKANKVLNIIFVAFILITLQIWHLASGQHEDKLQESRLPGRRIEIEAPIRGGIRDRFNEPLALNKLKFQAAILYSDFKAVPRAKWIVGEDGKKVKINNRKAYIKTLSELLAEELKLDPLRIEDEIHAKASQFFNIPYVIKETITEEEYARLKILAKDYPGIHPHRTYERIYPKGKVAADVIGYLGKIGKSEYESVIQQREELKLFLEGLDAGADLPLPEKFRTVAEVKKRLKELEELAYTASDWVGKTGIESFFEEDLRGFQGKRTVFKDAKGDLLREYPGKRDKIPGKRIILSLSSELQEYAEKLLALSEETRDTRVRIGSSITKITHKRPWIMGGSIVALDPHNGEVLALASYPRIDPNDFNAKNDAKIHTWLEDEVAASRIWDGLAPLTRERYDTHLDKFYDEEKPLTWELYLELILSKEGEVKTSLETTYKTIGRALTALKKKEADPKVLDLLAVALDERLFSEKLTQKVAHITLSDHRKNEQAAAELSQSMEEIIRGVFSETDFKAWREENEKEFIQEKRALEKAEHKYPKAYLDYLDEEERSQFKALWESNKHIFLETLLTGEGESSFYTLALKVWKKEIDQGAHKELSWIKSYHHLKKVIESLPKPFKREYLATLRLFSERERALKFGWRIPKKGSAVLKEKHLAKAFLPAYGYGYGRSHAFRQAAIQGSIFKLITAYTALIQKWRNKESLNLLEIDDHYFRMGKHAYVGYTAEKKLIPQLYKGGRIPRSHSSHLGKIDLLTALEVSSNPYFALLACDVIKNPQDLMEAAKKFSYGQKTGIDLPHELKGSLPIDLATNPTGLFATSIGQHTLIVTPLQTAVMLSSIANGGSTLKPKIVTLKAGKKRGNLYEEIPRTTKFPHKNELYLAGIDFPLLDLPPCKEEKLILPQPTIIQDKVLLPEKIRKILLEGMRRVVKRQSKSSLFSLSRIYKDSPEMISDFVDMKNHIVGKTSTSEAIERLDLDKPDEHPLYTHVWFGGISFEKPVKAMRFEDPDLVVVVYLKYGGYGNESAPIAAQIAKKWREIKAAHATKKK